MDIYKNIFKRLTDFFKKFTYILTPEKIKKLESKGKLKDYIDDLFFYVIHSYQINLQKNFYEAEFLYEILSTMDLSNKIILFPGDSPVLTLFCLLYYETNKFNYINFPLSKVKNPDKDKNEKDFIITKYLKLLIKENNLDILPKNTKFIYVDFIFQGRLEKQLKKSLKNLGYTEELISMNLFGEFNSEEVLCRCMPKVTPEDLEENFIETQEYFNENFTEHQEDLEDFMEYQEDLEETEEDLDEEIEENLEGMEEDLDEDLDEDLEEMEEDFLDQQENNFNEEDVNKNFMERINLIKHNHNHTRCNIMLVFFYFYLKNRDYFINFLKENTTYFKFFNYKEKYYKLYETDYTRINNDIFKFDNKIVNICYVKIDHEKDTLKVKILKEVIFKALPEPYGYNSWIFNKDDIESLENIDNGKYWYKKENYDRRIQIHIGNILEINLS